MAEQERADRFDEVVEAILARPERADIPADPELAALWRLAVDLLDLPSEAFRSRLMADLERRAEHMKQTAAVPYIPAGFRSVAPYVIVPGADRLIAFMKQAFGAEEVFRHAEPDGTVVHAEVRIGDSMLELSDGGPDWPSRPAAIHLYVPDADATYARAMAAGARSLLAPMDMPYGDREGDVTDPFGNNWYIATHLQDGPVPQGLGTLTPTLHVKGTDRLIDFIQRAFGAQELERTTAPDGTILHAQLQLADSVLELGEAHGFVQPRACAIHYFVEDVDRVYESALAAGATTLGAPSNRPYGHRAAEVQDPFGNYWFIARQLEDVRYR
jgi:PhnB protein